MTPQEKIEPVIWFGILETGTVVDVLNCRDHAEKTLSALQPHAYKEATIIELAELPPNSTIVPTAEYEKLKQDFELCKHGLGLANSLVAHNQAKIDSLMLEYCPEEMTGEQKATWAKHQAAVSHDVSDAIKQTIK